MDEMLAKKVKQGRLQTLKEVKVIIQLAIGESDTELEEPCKLVREAIFLPSLPVGKLVVLFKTSAGELLYDSQHNPSYE